MDMYKKILAGKLDDLKAELAADIKQQETGHSGTSGEKERREDGLDRSADGTENMSDFFRAPEQ